MAVTYETLCESKITDTEGCKLDTRSDKCRENIVLFSHAIRTRKYNKTQKNASNSSVLFEYTNPESYK